MPLLWTQQQHYRLARRNTMTLTLRFGSSFGDSTLPFLQKDFALPDTGSVQLVDFGRPSSYSSQAASFTSGEQFQTLVSTNAVTQGYAQATTAGTFDSATGALTGTVDLSPDTGNSFVIDDTSHNYCFSWWFKLPGGLGNNIKLAQSPPGGPRSFQLVTTPNGLFFNHWDTQSRKSTQYFYTPDTVMRLGYAWQWNGSTWQSKSISDNGSPSEWSNINFATQDSAVGLYNTAQGNNFIIDFGGAGSGATYRLLIEDLTESGRTPEEVWSADWASANGRFS